MVAHSPRPGRGGRRDVRRMVAPARTTQPLRPNNVELLHAPVSHPTIGHNQNHCLGYLIQLILTLFCSSSVNCIMSGWSSWTSCQATCGGPFSQTRTRRKTRQEANGGTCLDNSTSEFQQCGAAPCPGKQTKNCTKAKSLR